MGKSYSSVPAYWARILSCNSQPRPQHGFTNHTQPVHACRAFLSSETLYCCKKQQLQSQNHRIAGAGRHLWRSWSPTPPCKTGSIQQAAQVGIQLGLDNLQSRTIHSLPGQPVPELCHLTMNKFLLTSVQNFLYSSLWPFPPHSCPHRPLKKACPCPLDSHAHLSPGSGGMQRVWEHREQCWKGWGGAWGSWGAHGLDAGSSAVALGDPRLSQTHGPSHSPHPNPTAHNPQPNPTGVPRGRAVCWGGRAGLLSLSRSRFPAHLRRSCR